jgi:hypothetical protein
MLPPIPDDKSPFNEECGSGGLIDLDHGGEACRNWNRQTLFGACLQGEIRWLPG